MRWRNRSILWLIAVITIITAGLLVYSQTIAFHEDEGFHLLTAHFIKMGRRPYLDFAFPQTPLNAYLNAGWMMIFGESWRAVHVLATFETVGAVLLSAWFVLKRFPVPEWRLPSAVVVALLVGFNIVVIDFGTLAQAYAICLLLLVAAFYVSVLAVEREGLMLPALAGLFAGAAADSSLLTASACWVFLLWLIFYNRIGNRAAKVGAFIAGVVVAFLPAIWLFALAPRQTWFNIFQYHLFYRDVNWAGATRNNFEVLTAWINESQKLCLVLLAVAGLLFLTAKKEWGQSRRAELYLCLALAGAMGIQNAFAHPTFIQYFVVIVPFIAILASVGCYAIVAQFGFAEKPLRPILALALLLSLQVARTMYDERDDMTWGVSERMAKKIEDLTPPDGTLLADTQIYFLTHRPVPWGMENGHLHRLSLSPELNALYHILPQAELNRQIKAGAFTTIEMCKEDIVDSLNLQGMYEQNFDYPSSDDPSCSVFSGLKTKAVDASDTGQ